jgi:hypothetical protein
MVEVKSEGKLEGKSIDELLAMYRGNKQEIQSLNEEKAKLEKELQNIIEARD